MLLNRLKIYPKVFALTMALAFTTSCGNQVTAHSMTETTIEEEPDKDNLKLELYKITYDLVTNDENALNMIYSIAGKENNVIIYEPYNDQIIQNLSSPKKYETINEARTINQAFLDQIWENAQEQQIYIVGLEENTEGKQEYNQMLQEITNQYPNATYINIAGKNKEEEINQSINDNYQSTKVAIELIKTTLREWKEKGTAKLQQLDVEQTYQELKDKFKDIDKQDILDGIDKANHYITNTEWYHWMEQKSRQVTDYLEPRIEDVYQRSKPYLNQAKEKAQEIGSDVNQKAKQKVKKWLEIEN